MPFPSIKVFIEIPDAQSVMRDPKAFEAALNALLEDHFVGPHRKVRLVHSLEEEIPQVVMAAFARAAE